MVSHCLVFLFKKKTADEMRISDWSSDVCSSDLMDISDVGRTLNEAKWLPELLHAIADQEWGNWTAEVVLVDSGSTDATLDVARSFGCKIVTITKAQFTFGRSLNVGCDVASGRFQIGRAHV